MLIVLLSPWNPVLGSPYRLALRLQFASLELIPFGPWQLDRVSTWVSNGACMCGPYKPRVYCVHIT